MHTCVGNLTIIGSDNGLSPGQCQAIIWTNTGILLIGPLGTNFSEILIEIYAFENALWKMVAISSRPQCVNSLRLGDILASGNNTGRSFIGSVNSWASDTIWWQGYVSKLAQVMTFCLMAPGHYLDQFWLLVSEVLWRLPYRIFTVSAGDTIRIVSLKIVLGNKPLPEPKLADWWTVGNYQE